MVRGVEAAKAIAEPRRREILRLVRDGERSVGEIAGHFDVTQPAISQHLKVLERAGLVTVRADGTRRLYRLRTDGLVDLRVFLEELWGRRLERLGDVVAADVHAARGPSERAEAQQ